MQDAPFFVGEEEMDLVSGVFEILHDRQETLASRTAVLQIMVGFALRKRIPADDRVYPPAPASSSQLIAVFHHHQFFANLEVAWNCPYALSSAAVPLTRRPSSAFCPLVAPVTEHAAGAEAKSAVCGPAGLAAAQSAAPG